ncbi:GNAT family N-acetyltransferase [candidate division WOR-3 bacterium]|nr:GNAT family N-acetyltransferase [candidate division WOR-3 bacterium]
MEVINLTEKYMHFVSVCTHIDDLNEEMKYAASIREKWIKDTIAKGLKIKVAVDKGKPVGSAHCLPIELGSWGVSGKDLMTIPCLAVQYRRIYNRARGSGIGRALIKAVEEEAKESKKNGVAVLCYDNDSFFMPSAFFKKLGYKEIERQNDTVIAIKAWSNVDPPVMHKLNYKFKPVKGKVVVDALWTPICLTSIIEIQRVREVCTEYGDKVILNEYNCGNKKILEKYQTQRALFFNGKYKNWGYSAPQDELQETLNQEIKRSSVNT